MLAVVTGSVALALACDGGGITPPDNVAPVANFEMPTCTVNVDCDFSSTSTDDAGVTDWSWDFDGDGDVEANTASASFMYNSAATFNVSLTVHDAQGLSHKKTSTITVAPNPAPAAGFTYTCSATDCTFLSTSTDVAPGTIATYAWDFGDGSITGEKDPSHSYTVATPREFTVTLTVTDNEGATDVETQTVTVTPLPPANTPPKASFTNACNVVDCTFASTSTDDAPGTIATYAWTFGDGGTAVVSNPAHRYNVTAPTTFTVTLTVKDNEGASAVATKQVAITPLPQVNTPPTADFTHACNVLDCTFASTSSDVAPGRIATYAWTFGDGATAVVSNPVHQYTVAAPTDFTVTLTVTDNEGATAIKTKQITVSPVPSGNIAPTASFKQWCEWADCIFISTSTDVAPGTIASYVWTFGDGTTVTEWNKPGHSYKISARTTFTVTLTVTDNEGATDVEVQTVTLNPMPPAAQGCITTGKVVDCFLDIPTNSTLKVKLLEVACDLKNNPASRITTPPPIGDQVFLSVCWRPAGQEIGIFGGPLDKLIVYQAGTQARIQFTQGDANPSDPILAPPVGQITGNFPDWTINFEDGDHPTRAGEPDFTDVVIGVHATVVP
jgi:PKD repeat protein